MSGKTDELKGRVKEAAGAIADDDRMRREGKTDQAAGKVKQKIEQAVDKAKEGIERLNERQGKIGWAVLWLLGVPLPVLLVLYLIMGGH
ncbi:MAG TPA: CsbD family protein [Pirellulales bacterium]|nr:CsbD family protein [Pirellulales bacterium]